jgi:hypothetical protein
MGMGYRQDGVYFPGNLYAKAFARPIQWNVLVFLLKNILQLNYIQFRNGGK